MLGDIMTLGNSTTHNRTHVSISDYLSSAGQLLVMSSLRSSLILSRPSIRDLTTFLFSPSTRQCTHCITSRAPTAAISPRRAFSAKSRFLFPAVRHSTAPKSHDRGPASIEDTQTDFGALNVLGNTPVPSTSIDACLWDGFHLNSGVKIVGGQGVLLVGGEAFAWCPWEAEKSRGKTLVDGKGRFDVEDESWGLLGLVWPKPGWFSFYILERCFGRGFY